MPVSTGSGVRCRNRWCGQCTSYAFAILRLQAAAHGNPPPRLITGSEQVVLRELFAGDIEDGADYWPKHLRGRRWGPTVLPRRCGIC